MLVLEGCCQCCISCYEAKMGTMERSRRSAEHQEYQRMYDMVSRKITHFHDAFDCTSLSCITFNYQLFFLLLNSPFACDVLDSV